MPLPVQAWGIEFGVLKRSVRTVDRGIHQIIYLKKGTTSYLTVRSKLSIQSYASRMDRPTEEVGVSFLPPGVKRIGIEVDSCPVVQVKRRKI